MRFLLPRKFINQFIALIKQHGISFALSITIVMAMLLHASQVLPLIFIHQLENYSYDLRLNLLMPRTLDSRIVIVNIDEKSLAEQGRWPWSRDKLAVMMDRLFDDYHINTLGFDVVFAEKDESSGLKNLQWMQQKYLQDDANFANALNLVKSKLDYDQIFADSLKNRKIVLGYYFQTRGDSNRNGQLPAEIFSADSFDGSALGLVASGYGANLAILQQNAYSAGHFNPEPDADGITRKVSVFVQYQQNYYESLALAVARAYLDNPVIEAKFASLGVGKNYSGLGHFFIQYITGRHILKTALYPAIRHQRGQMTIHRNALIG